MWPSLIPPRETLGDGFRSMSVATKEPECTQPNLALRTRTVRHLVRPSRTYAQPNSRMGSGAHKCDRWSRDDAVPMAEMTRWQKAKEDWPGPQWRDLTVGPLGLVIAVLVLDNQNYPGDTIVEVVVVAAATVVAVVLFSLGQLGWAWLNAPMRLLAADVRAIRERLEEMPQAQETDRPLPTGVTLRNQIRLGRELLRVPHGPREERQWADGVVEALGHAIPTELEGVLNQVGLVDQVAALEAVAARHTPPYRTTAILRA